MVEERPVRQLGITDLGEVPAARLPSLAAALLRDGRPRLCLVRPTGAVLSLGRWQEPSLTLSAAGLGKPRVQRLGGGPAAVLGEGLWSVLLALPNRGWADVSAPGLPMERLLNRAVRPLLSALAQLGVAASYPGRDAVLVDGGRAGLLSFDADANGHVLVECHLPAGAHWWAPESLLQEPVACGRGAPPPAMVSALEAVTAGRVIDACAQGLRDRLGVSVLADDAPLVIDDATVPPPSLCGQLSARVETSTGALHAGLTLREGRIDRAALYGAFLADAGGMAALTARLVGAAPTSTLLVGAVEALMADAAHALLGAAAPARLGEAWMQALRGVDVG